VYLVDSYWDKDKQQPRQKRTYLGRKDERSGKIVSTKKSSKPKGSYRFGSVYFLIKIVKKLKLSKVLRLVFPDDYLKYLALAFFKVVESDPYCLYDLWQEDNYIFEESTIGSQRISELLLELGKDEKGIEQFFGEWIKLNDSATSVMFDITSISSYSEHNELVELGYNRDKEKLEQVNIGIISREGCKDALQLPLAYRIYSGSIPDVVTLKNVISLIGTYELNLSCFVMDKGFYSQQNIKDMHKKCLKFLIPLPFSTSLAKELASNFDGEINSPLGTFSFHSKVYSHFKKRIKINGVTCTAHMYLDKERKAREENKLMQKITELEKVFCDKKFKSQAQAEQYIIETLKSKKKFFVIRKKQSTFLITRNKKIISQELLLMGKVILITNSNKIDKDNALKLYRSKDGIEKVFLSMKHHINEKRSRTKSSSTMKGNAFINFLALIILAYVDQIMSENHLYKKFSKNVLFKTLDKLKVFELANEQILLGEISKRQKIIMEAFKLSKKIQPSYNLAGF